jgi:hypothetical protein
MEGVLMSKTTIKIGPVTVYGDVPVSIRMDIGNIVESHKGYEKEARLKLQTLIDTYGIKADIMYAGNYVWSYDRLIRDFTRIMRKGTTDCMTNYLYKFFSLSCGSIAHYSKSGWCSVYPTAYSLKQFLQRNEFGEPVLQYMPHWKTDAKRVVEQMEKIAKIRF